MKEQDRKHSGGNLGEGRAGDLNYMRRGPGLGDQWSLCPLSCDRTPLPPPRLSMALLHIDLLTFKAYSSHGQEVSGPVMVDGKLGHLWMT